VVRAQGRERQRERERRGTQNILVSNLPRHHGRPRQWSQERSCNLSNARAWDLPLAQSTGRTNTAAALLPRCGRSLLCRIRRDRPHSPPLNDAVLLENVTLSALENVMTAEPSAWMAPGLGFQNTKPEENSKTKPSNARRRKWTSQPRADVSVFLTVPWLDSQRTTHTRRICWTRSWKWVPVFIVLLFSLSHARPSPSVYLSRRVSSSFGTLVYEHFTSKGLLGEKSRTNEDLAHPRTHLLKRQCCCGRRWWCWRGQSPSTRLVHGWRLGKVLRVS